MNLQTIKVTGMTCHHCVMSVTEELGEIPGVTGVSVDLVPDGASTVTLTADAPIDDEAISAAVAEAGYTVAPPSSLP
jgi:copper chaperone